MHQNCFLNEMTFNTWHIASKSRLLKLSSFHECESGKGFSPFRVLSPQRCGALDSEQWMDVSTLTPRLSLLIRSLLGSSVTRISVARISWGFSSRSLVGSAHIYQTPWPLPEPRPGTRRPPKLPASTRWQLRSALPMWHNFLEFTSPHLALIICWLVIVVICLKALSSLPDCKPLLCLPWQPCALGGEEILGQPCPNQCARDPESPTKNPITNIWRGARSLAKSPALQNDFPVSYFHRCESKGLCF